jgi:hypothetical protein
MQAAADPSCEGELAVLFSIFAQQQHHPFIPTELGPVSRKLSPAHCSFQHPIDVNILPAPERFLRKKKARNLLKKASPQIMNSKPKPVEESNHESRTQESDEYDRVLERLLSVHG